MAKKKKAAPVVETPAVEETSKVETTTAPQFDDLDGVTITTTGEPTQQVKPEYEKIVEQANSSVNVTSGNSLEKIMDSQRKLAYVIDASGSMSDGMRDEELIDAYEFTSEKLNALRTHLKKMEKAASQAGDENDEFEAAFDEYAEDVVKVSELPDDELKRHIIANAKAVGRWGASAISFEGFEFKIVPGKSTSSINKMQALKRAAKKFVGDRFLHVKDALVSVFQFEHEPKILCYSGASEPEVIKAIDALPEFGGGGTDIYRAVLAALNEFKARPSLVGANHMVLVSDGLDNGAMRVLDLLQRMKDLTLVFDFIYLQGNTPDNEAERVAKVLRQICEATGGEYTVVKTNQDFEQKFLEVSNRPLLPAARS